jgi:hypothetical protein
MMNVGPRAARLALCALVGAALSGCGGGSSSAPAIPANFINVSEVQPVDASFGTVRVNGANGDGQVRAFDVPLGQTRPFRVYQSGRSTPLAERPVTFNESSTVVVFGTQRDVDFAVIPHRSNFAGMIPRLVDIVYTGMGEGEFDVYLTPPHHDWMTQTPANDQPLNRENRHLPFPDILSAQGMTTIRVTKAGTRDVVAETQTMASFIMTVVLVTDHPEDPELLRAIVRSSADR